MAADDSWVDTLSSDHQGFYWIIGPSGYSGCCWQVASGELNDIILSSYQGGYKELRIELERKYCRYLKESTWAFVIQPLVKNLFILLV